MLIQALLSFSKTKRRVSVLKVQAKAAADLAKACASPSAGSQRKVGKNMDKGNKGAKDVKESTKVRNITMAKKIM